MSNGRTRKKFSNDAQGPSKLLSSLPKPLAAPLRLATEPIVVLAMLVLGPERAAGAASSGALFLTNKPRAGG